MTITAQTSDNEALAKGSLQTGWQTKSCLAAWNSLEKSRKANPVLLPRFGRDEVDKGCAPAGSCTEVVLLRNVPAALSYSCTGKVHQQEFPQHLVPTGLSDFHTEVLAAGISSRNFT